MSEIENQDCVVDTHAMIWHVTESPRLPPRAQALLAAADEGRIAIFVPSILFAEIVYLVEKGRIQETVLERIIEYVSEPLRSYHLRPLDLTVVQAMRQIPKASVPDMPDRIVAATASALGLPLITADARIRSSGVVPVVW